MNKIEYACLIVLVAVTAGCHTTDPSVAMMESENRQLENVVWEFKYDNDMLALDLQSCRRENDALRRELANATGQSSGGGSSAPGVPGIDIDLGEPMGGGVPTEALPIPERGQLDLSPPQEAVLDTHVTHIVLNPRLTGGYDFDRQGGDEGVMVVIEPRNAAGQYVSMTGPISVVVIDPNIEGSEARVARWDFTGVEANQLIKDSLLGQGIHLEMPWPNQPPQNPNLRLFVRYTTIDSRDLETDFDFRVTQLGSISSRWTPSSSPRAETGDLSPHAELPATESILSPPRTSDALRGPIDLSPRTAILPGTAGGNREDPSPTSSPQSPQWRPFR